MKLHLKIKTEDFIKLVNSGEIIIGIDDLDYIKSQIIIKPKIEDSIISISNTEVESQLKSILNTCLLSLELC